MDPLEAENILDQFYYTITHKYFGGRLPLHLRQRIEQFPIDQRREIVCTTLEHGQNLLFLACYNRDLNTVKYLLEICGANINQKGILPVFPLKNHVTPLWYAAHSRNLALVKLLVEHGADINCGSNTRSTPLAVACLRNHFDIAEYLVNKGADPCIPNDNGFTPLMYSLTNMCILLLLLKKGVDIQAQNIKSDTALHIACRNTHFSTVEILLHYGASPWIQNKNGDDALQTACVSGSNYVVELLLETFSYTLERTAEAYELIGASQQYPLPPREKIIQYWKTALEIRQKHQIEKKMMPPKEIFMCVKEFATIEELENLPRDLCSLELQSILVHERILGPFHKHTLCKIEKIARVAYLYEVLSGEKHYGYILFNYVVESFIRKHGILHYEVDIRVRILFFWYSEMYRKETIREEAGFANILHTIRILISHLKVLKNFEGKENIYDNLLKIVTGILSIIISLSKTHEEQQHATAIVQEVIKTNICSSRGDSFLHMVLTKSIINIFYRDPVNVSAHAQLIEMMLRCGGNLDVKNHDLNTPLHIICLTENFQPKIVSILLKFGAHIDCRNGEGQLCQDLLKIRRYDLKLMDFMTLQCLSARTIIENKIPFKGQIPKKMESFVEMH